MNNAAPGTRNIGSQGGANCSYRQGGCQLATDCLNNRLSSFLCIDCCRICMQLLPRSEQITVERKSRKSIYLDLLQCNGGENNSLLLSARQESIHGQNEIRRLFGK